MIILNQANDESKFIIGCVSCSRKNRHIEHGKFPAETAFSKEELKDFFNSYTCPFCGTTYTPTPNMMKMITRFMDGFTHVRTIGNEAEVYGIETKFAFSPEREQGEQNKELYEQLKEYVFQNPDEDLPLLLEAIKDIDLSKWYIRIESAKNPVPLIRDDTLWFDVLTGDIINKEK